MTELEKINAELLEAYKRVDELETKKNELMRIGFVIPEKKHVCKSCQCKPKNKLK